MSPEFLWLSNSKFYNEMVNVVDTETQFNELDRLEGTR